MIFNKWNNICLSTFSWKCKFFNNLSFKLASQNIAWYSKITIVANIKKQSLHVNKTFWILLQTNKFEWRHVRCLFCPWVSLSRLSKHCQKQVLTKIHKEATELILVGFIIALIKNVEKYVSNPVKYKKSFFLPWLWVMRFQ